MYLIDTDTLSLAHREQRDVNRRILATPADQLFIAVVTVEETMRGCLADINASARNPSRLIVAYDRLQIVHGFLMKWNVLPLDHEAAKTYADLVKRKVRVHTNDLRIAAIALSCNFIVVTANVRHFQRVPTLRVEDWTR